MVGYARELWLLPSQRVYVYMNYIYRVYIEGLYISGGGAKKHKFMYIYIPHLK